VTGAVDRSDEAGVVMRLTVYVDGQVVGGRISKMVILVGVELDPQGGVQASKAHTFAPVPGLHGRVKDEADAVSTQAIIAPQDEADG